VVAVEYTGRADVETEARGVDYHFR